MLSGFFKIRLLINSLDEVMALTAWFIPEQVVLSIAQVKCSSV
jgi:hypothetical protein